MSPSENIDYVNKRVQSSCVASNCSKQGCTLSLKGLSNLKVLVDLDKPGAPVKQGSPKCDYIMFACINKNDTFCVAPIEMKRGSANASKMTSQLVAGAEIAMRLVSKQPDTKFIPIAVYGGRLHSVQSRNFRSKRVKFHGESYPITLVRSGNRLIDFLK